MRGRHTGRRDENNLSAIERIESAEDSDLGIAGCCGRGRAGEDEKPCVWDVSVPVEDIEDELLDGLRHG